MSIYLSTIQLLSRLSYMTKVGLLIRGKRAFEALTSTSFSELFSCKLGWTGKSPQNEVPLSYAMVSPPGFLFLLVNLIVLLFDLAFLLLKSSDSYWQFPFKKPFVQLHLSTW